LEGKGGKGVREGERIARKGKRSDKEEEREEHSENVWRLMTAVTLTVESYLHDSYYKMM